MPPTAAATTRSVKRPLYLQTYVQVILAIIAGVLVGHFFKDFALELKLLGDAFIKLIKMIIAPVIFLTITVGIARMNHLGEVGRVMLKSMIYFLAMSTGALVIGLVVALVVKPGEGAKVDLSKGNTNKAETLDSKADASSKKADEMAIKADELASKAKQLTFSRFFLDIIPDTVMGAFTSGNVLQVLFIAILFGISLVMIGERAEPVINILEDLAAPIFKMVSLVMLFAPIGAFGAMAAVIGEHGVKTLLSLIYLVATFYISSVLFIVIVLGIVAWLSGFSIIRLMYYLREELFLILGTSSSESALPALIDKMEKAGCSKAVVGLVVPTGYSFNLDGTNIYLTLATLFIAQALKIDLSWSDIALLLAVAIFSSKGAAGITGAGLVALAATVSILDIIPAYGIALVIPIDKFMSECRALTNFIGNAVATVVVARWEGALDMEKLKQTLDGSFGKLQPEVAESSN